MRLLVVGATGGPARLRLRHQRLTLAHGDILDYTSVEAAVRGKRWFYPNRILSLGTSHLVRAMEANGVRRLICETSLGLGESCGQMGLYYTFVVIPVILPLYFWDKRRQERVIRASSLDWTIVRPGVLTNRPPRHVYRHGERVGHRLWTVRISRADVAAFMLDQLSDPRHLRQAPGGCW